MLAGGTAVRGRSARLPVGVRRGSDSGDSTGLHSRVPEGGAALRTGFRLRLWNRPGGRSRRPGARPALGRRGRRGREKASVGFASSVRGCPGRTLFLDCPSPSSATFGTSGGALLTGWGRGTWDPRGLGRTKPASGEGCDEELGEKRVRPTTPLVVLSVPLGGGRLSLRAATRRAVSGPVGLSREACIGTGSHAEDCSPHGRL